MGVGEGGIPQNIEGLNRFAQSLLIAVEPSTSSGEQTAPTIQITSVDIIKRTFDFSEVSASIKLLALVAHC